ncbi:ComF family protein [bacterium]|nr:ComF family protein [bacterium]
MSVLSEIKAMGTGVRDLFFPRSCALCGVRTEDGPICKKCGFEFEINLTARCSNCGKIIEQTTGCPNCGEEMDCFLLPVLHFNEITREMIHLLKYGGRIDVGHHIGSVMAELLDIELFEGVDAFLPVPLHPVKKRSRGYNQSEIIAERLGSEFGIYVERKAIKRIRNTGTQTKLNVVERQNNVSGAFEAKLQLTNRTFVIIDDVITTGATTRELASTVKSAGGNVKFAVSIASPELEQSLEHEI